LPVVLYGCETWSLTLREKRGLRVFENVLRRIFGPKRDEVTGEWRKLHNEELGIPLYHFHVPTVLKCGSLDFLDPSGPVQGCTGIDFTSCVLLGSKDHWGDPGVDGRIILRWFFRKWDVGYGLDWAGSGSRQVAGPCECGNEPSGSIKCGKFLDWLQTG
jgi:hypothetical protein